MLRDLFNFWKISDNILKTVRDSLIVSIKFEWEVVYALSNGYVAVLPMTLVTPKHVKPPQFLHFALLCASS